MDPSQIDWIEVSRTSDGKTAEDHALVLEAMGIVSATAHVGGIYAVVVRREDAPRASAELARFTGENAGFRAVPPPPRMISSGASAAAAFSVLLVLAFALERRYGFGFDWVSAGRADAALIRGGAWWRAITALCLHADALHLAGNVVFGALFCAMLAQSVGSGLAALTFVLSGGLGNALNAWLQPPTHASLGASTAVFGMLGAQIALDWIERRRYRYSAFRRAAPVVMGAALLAWLGGGERALDADAALPPIDVWAHVLGFAAGMGLGALYAAFASRLPRSAAVQSAIAVAAYGVVALAWVLALR